MREALVVAAAMVALSGSLLLAGKHGMTNQNEYCQAHPSECSYGGPR